MIWAHFSSLSAYNSMLMIVAVLLCYATHSVKLVFSYVIKRTQIKIAAKFRASRRLRFEDTMRTISPEMRPKSFGTFEKWVPGARFSKIPKLFG